MDNSEINFKMCKKAKEIQALRPFGKAWIRGDAFITEGKLTKYRLGHRCHKDIWIPHQYQLQEMSGLDWRSFDKKCLVYENPTSVPTKEQAGLRVVMSEKHGKFWSGGNWVKH